MTKKVFIIDDYGLYDESKDIKRMLEFIISLAEEGKNIIIIEGLEGEE